MVSACWVKVRNNVAWFAMGPYVMRLRTLFYRGSARKLSLKCNFPQMTRIEDRRFTRNGICEDQRVFRSAKISGKTMSGIQLPRGVSQIRALCYKINLCSIEGPQKNAGRQTPTYSGNSHILITVPSITHLLTFS